MKKTRLKNFDIEFDEKLHAYRTKDGELYAGVTEIVGLMDKGFMGAWAALETVKFLEPLLEGIKEMSKAEWKQTLENAKKRWRDIGAEAQMSGTEAHDWIEQYIKANIESEEASHVLPEGQEARAAVCAFLDWVKEHKIRWHASEVIVGSHLFRFAGTLDALATIDGKLTLVDFKTSKAIYPEYWIQIGGYQIALEEMQIVPQRRLVVRIPKDGKPVEVQEDAIPLDLCQKTFLALREASKFRSYVKNHQKE